MSKADKKHSDFGLQHAIEAVSALEGEARDRLIARIASEDPELAKILQNAQLSFESLVDSNPTGFQELISKVNDTQLCIALRGANKDLLEKVFLSMSQRKALQLKEDIIQMGPQPKSRVDEARSEILKLAKEMMDQGKLIILDRNKDKLV